MKSMKKLVLAGLVLLVSVMGLVLLAGCKNDSVPEVPQGPKVYTFPAGVKILSAEEYTSPNHTDNTWTYVAFGEWPQTIKAEDVTVDETKRREMGMFTAYLGSDGNYYVKAKERAYDLDSEYKYSDGTQVGRNGTSTKWFKVEPIVWRILNKDYAETGTALLLAENILTGEIPYYSGKNFNRTTAISPNDYKHSQIRAFLNGLSYEYKGSDSGEQIQKTEYKGKGFLQTAFTQEVQKLVTDTEVDNSPRSTNPDSNASQWNSGANAYFCANTKDKIFLLSEQEATKEDYGFAKYDQYGRGNTRIRVATDYAKATGAYQSSTAGYGGCWWLRSPYYGQESHARSIYYDGRANINSTVNDARYDRYGSVHNAGRGVVPALSISINGN